MNGRFDFMLSMALLKTKKNALKLHLWKQTKKSKPLKVQLLRLFDAWKKIEKIIPN